MKSSITFCLIFVILLVVLIVLAGGPDAVVHSNKVESNGVGNTVEISDYRAGRWRVLTEKQAAWFVRDLSTPALRSLISECPAFPRAEFRYDGKIYLMHGNAVIHVDENGTEYLWSGPYLQALVRAANDLRGGSIFPAVDQLEALPNLDGIEMDQPGAYPGGGPAPLVPDPTRVPV